MGVCQLLAMLTTVRFNATTASGQPALEPATLSVSAELGGPLVSLCEEDEEEVRQPHRAQVVARDGFFLLLLFFPFGIVPSAACGIPSTSVAPRRPMTVLDVSVK